MKDLIKKILPKSLLRILVNPYHLLEAIVANLRYGFPARSAQVIMVTGTNGKTTTAAYMVKILEAAGHKVGASTTAFYKVGDKTIINDQNMTVVNVFKLQRYLAEMKQAGCEYIVLEVTSHALMQNRVWGIPCDVAIMTNLTQDHLDYHQTMEKYAAAKGRLFERAPRLIVLNHDDQWFDYFSQFKAKERKVSYGTKSGSTIAIDDVKLHKDGSDVKLMLDGREELAFHTQLPGKFNVYNATAAATAGFFLHVEPEQISQGIADLDVVPGRMEGVKEGQNFDIFIDYAHTPDALQNLLETLRHLTQGKLFVVFGATGDRDKVKRPIMGEIAGRLADKVLLTDDEPYSEDPATIRQAVLAGVAEADKPKVTEVDDRREAIAQALKQAHKGDTVVVTGMGHEQFRIVNGQRQPWNDAQVVREILTESK